MIRIFPLFCFSVFCLNLNAHPGLDHEKTSLKTWQITSAHKTIEAYFLMLKNRIIYLEDAQQQVLKYPLSALAPNDQIYAVQKFEQIEKLNAPAEIKSDAWMGLFYKSMWLAFGFFAISGALFFFRLIKIKLNYYFAILILCSAFFSFRTKLLLGTDPKFIDSVFSPFKPNVKTHWDNQYFYVEGLGLPTHPMMSGITSWQQQFPIPQCYTGANAWSIPLNPVVAVTPIPTAKNFFKGAIGIAANGIPVFNALNNRGEDSYLIGELDKYGGHCGRADDYHYHIAPLGLDSINADILPIAFALDGFAVYGNQEPDGTLMKTLDTNHGHNLTGVYHYHGTKTYPYMVGNMVGVVTKDSTDQIVPQAQTKPIRQAGAPLNGAVIINDPSTGTNAYSLTYTLNNQTYTVNYSWTNAGAYTFNFVSPTGNTTTSNFTAQICSLSTDVDDIFLNESFIKIYPNPAKSGFSLDLSSPYNFNDINSITILDMQGKLVSKINGYKNFIETPNFTSGIYFIKIQFSFAQLTKKLMIE